MLLAGPVIVAVCETLQTLVIGRFRFATEMAVCFIMPYTAGEVLAVDLNAVPVSSGTAQRGHQNVVMNHLKHVLFNLH